MSEAPLLTSEVLASDVLTSDGETEQRARRHEIVGMLEEGVAGTQGFEPRYAAPEAAVLPLDDVPIDPNSYFTRPGPANPPRPA